MDIKRIGCNPSNIDPARSRSSQISIHNGTVYFAATPDRPYDPASVTVQTQQMLKRVEERLVLAGSDKSKMLFAHVMIADMRYFAEMNAVWDAWVDQDSPPARACGACDLGSTDMKVEIIVTAAVK